MSTGSIDGLIYNTIDGLIDRTPIMRIDVYEVYNGYFVYLGSIFYNQGE